VQLIVKFKPGTPDAAKDAALNRGRAKRPDKANRKAFLDASGDLLLVSVDTSTRSADAGRRANGNSRREVLKGAAANIVDSERTYVCVHSVRAGVTTTAQLKLLPASRAHTLH
jgi:hypothetical protein